MAPVRVEAPEAIARARIRQQIAAESEFRVGRRQTCSQARLRVMRLD